MRFLGLFRLGHQARLQGRRPGARVVQIGGTVSRPFSVAAPRRPPGARGAVDRKTRGAPGRNRPPAFLTSAAAHVPFRAAASRLESIVMHRYRTHTCGALRASRHRQGGAAFRLVPPHPRPWRLAVHRPARPLRHHPGGGRPGFALLQGGREAALGMGGAGRRQGAQASRQAPRIRSCRPARSRSISARSRCWGPRPSCRCRCSATRNIPRRSGSNTASSTCAASACTATSCCAAR